VNFDGSTVSTTGTFQTTGNTDAIPADAIFCGGAGTVAVVSESGIVTGFTLAVGEILPVRAMRVNSTGTAATLLVALYTI
jgi:hypothetical protein